MTITDLKRLHALNKEIEYEKKMLLFIRKKCDHVGIIGVGSVKKSQYSAEIASLENQIDSHLKECFALYNEILEFINHIPDPLLRLALSLKYVNGLEWEQVAMHIGGGISADCVRKLCNRYLKKTIL